MYERELRNHEADEHDEGTVWFSESNAEAVVLRQLNKLEEQGFLSRELAILDQDTATSDKASAQVSSASPSRFLDLGTGNGHMLFELCEDDEDGHSWCGELVGVDYSEASIQLAQRIASQKAAETSHPDLLNLHFEQWDLLASPPGSWLKNGFDVVLDKGTFDAISLMQHHPRSQHPCETSRMKVTPLVKPGYFLLVTSCNWTRAELVRLLTHEMSELEYFDEAKYPTFSFGGRTGQSVVTVIFRRKALSGVQPHDPLP